MLRNIALGILSVSILASVALADEVGFASKPAAVRSGDAVTITFAARSACDVTVAIVNSDGKIVRHLAGGMLGDNAPAPLAKGTLAQSLTWDGRDDLGKLVPEPAACRVSVALGTRAEFDRILAWSGQNIEDVRGAACGPDGTLYLFYGGQLYAHRRTTIVSAFDRDGKYLRQVMPGPGDLPADRQKGWPHITLDDGRQVPIVQQVLSRALLPGVWLGDRLFPVVTGDGRLIVPSSNDPGFARTEHPDIRGGRRLLILGTDASVPENFLGPVIAGEEVNGHGMAAVSPDNKWAYVTGLGGGKVGRQNAPLQNVVWRVPLDGSAKPEVLIGKLNAADAAAEGMNDPLGIAADAKGNIYVGEHGSNRVSAWTADGKFLKALAVDKPWQVQVSRRTGALYVVAEDGAKLLKFNSMDDAAPVASLATAAKPYPQIRLSTLIALDDSGEQAAIWLITRFWHSGKVSKLVDQGASFEDAGPVIDKQQAQPAMNFTAGLAVAGGRLATMNQAFGYNWKTDQILFDIATGKYVGKLSGGKTAANEVFAGMDGRLYTLGGGYQRAVPLTRYTPDGKAVPYGDTKTLDGFWHGHTRTGGAFVDRKGDSYFVGADDYREWKKTTVRHYSADGKLINASLVTLDAFFGGLAVDSKGNLYLGVQVAPKDELVPEFFNKNLPPDTTAHHPRQAYRQYGAVVKFGPEGGSIEPGDGGYLGGRGTAPVPVRLVGAKWYHRGGSIPVRGGDYGAYCHCETSRFGIDGFDRLFVPDIPRFSVRVLDSAGNQIAEIGSYGNMDNRGPKSDHPTPGIAYSWPLAAQVSDGVLYVADVTNRRVVAARLTAAASDTCDIK